MRLLCSLAGGVTLKIGRCKRLRMRAGPTQTPLLVNTEKARPSAFSSAVMKSLFD